MAPTAAGERRLTRMRPLLDDFDAVLDSINAFRDKPAGLLRLTVPPPAASFMLAPLLSRFLAQYPAIDLEISVDATLTDIVAGRFDAGMRAGELRRRETGPWEFRRPVADKLVEKPLQDRRLRRSGPNMDQRRQDIRQKPAACRVQPNMTADLNAVIAIAKPRDRANRPQRRQTCISGTSNCASLFCSSV